MPSRNPVGIEYRERLALVFYDNPDRIVATIRSQDGAAVRFAGSMRGRHEPFVGNLDLPCIALALPPIVHGSVEPYPWTLGELGDQLIPNELIALHGSNLARMARLQSAIQIGAVAEEKLHTYCHYNPVTAEALLRDSWIGAADVARAARCQTTLRRMSQADFDLLERHGYETAKWNLMLFVLTEEERQLAARE